MRTHDDELIHRVEVLESENGRLRRQRRAGGLALVAAAFVAGVVGCSGAVPDTSATEALAKRVAALEARGTPDNISAKSFTLVDDAGATVGSLALLEGVPVFRLGNAIGPSGLLSPHGLVISDGAQVRASLTPSTFSIGGKESSIMMSAEPRVEALVTCAVSEGKGEITGRMSVHGDKLPDNRGIKPENVEFLRKLDTPNLGHAEISVNRNPGGTEAFSMAKMELAPNFPPNLELTTGNITPVHLDASPTLILADENVTRAQLGVVDLVNKKTGSETKHQASTITLFDKDGNVLWMMPNE